MFEHKRLPLLSRGAFIRLQLRFLLVATIFVGFSLGVGVLGYMHWGGFTFVDAFMNASMILGGMGPVGDLPDDSAKWFASCYALYSGIALLGSVAVILTPLVHRMMHALHLDDEDRA
ncbi:MAG: hypothetical protein KDB84_11105 [Flavobacteriales bacterium]|nr:hypothetical protein [Flavobacteriales bacterium]